MAVAFDAVGPSSSGQGNLGATTLTWSHTVAAGGVLLVGCSLGQSSSDSGFTTTCTFDGVAMTSLGVKHSGNITAGYVQVWGLLTPTTGTAKTVLITASGGTPTSLSGGSMSFTGAVSFGTATSTNLPTATSTATATLTGTTAGNIVAGFACAGTSFSSATAPSTSRYSILQDSTSAAGASAGATSVAGGSVTMAWTLGGADDYAEILVEVKGPPAYNYPLVGPRLSEVREPGTYSSRPQLQQVANPAQTFFGTATLAGASVMTANSEPPFITGLASTGTGISYFTGSNGVPRMAWGDAAWGFIGNAGRWSSGAWQADMDSFASTRGNQGFTVIYTKPMGTLQSGNLGNDGRTFDSLYPFQGGSNANPSTGLTEAYWARIDYFFNATINQGITVFLNAIGYDSDFDTGPGPLAGKNTTEFQAYGAALGARYKNTPNLVYVLADDYFGFNDSLITAFLTGLRGAGDTHNVSIENFPETTSRKNISDSSALAWGTTNADFNWAYSYQVAYFAVEYAYTEASPITVLSGDGYFYQGTGATNDRAFRQDSWHALSSGARGKIHGSEAIWQWQSNAPADSASDANQHFYATTAKLIRNAVEALPGWHLLLPDTSSALVTGGRGTRATFTSAQYEVSFTDAYVTASRTADGSLALIYMSHATTITIDQTQLVGGYRAWWIDPATGTKTPATPGSTYNSTAKGNNSAGDPDWVLALQADQAPDYPNMPIISEIRVPGKISSRPTLQIPGPITIDSAPVLLAGASTLTTNVTQAPLAVITGASALTALVTQAPLAPITAASTLTALVTQAPLASITGAGSLTALVTQAPLVSITGAATLTALVTQIPTIPTISALSTLTASASVAIFGVANIGAGSTLIALVTQAPLASITAAGSLTPLVTQAPLASITGAGTLTALVTQAPLINISGAGSFTALVTQAPLANITAAGSLTALVTQAPLVSVTAASSLTALVTQAPKISIIAVATLTASGTSSSGANGVTNPTAAATLTALVTQSIIAPITATGTLTANWLQTYRPPAALAGAAVLTAVGVELIRKQGMANLVGASSLVAVIVQYNFSLWDGVTEVPLTLEGEWNGTTVIPLTFETVT